MEMKEHKNGGVMEDLAKLFQIGDEEHKGFLIRRDMQRLQGEMSLSADELEAVFDSLDSESRGYLTLDKFLVGYNKHRTSTNKDLNANLCEKSVLIPQEISSIITDVSNNMLLTKSTNDQLNELSQLMSDSQHLSLWEKFLYNLNQDMKRTQEHMSQLEALMNTRESQHKSYVRKLFEDLETQLREEKDRVVEEETRKLNAFRVQMGNELEKKKEDFEQLREQNSQLELKLADALSQEQKLKAMMKQINCDQEFYACQIENLQKSTMDLQTELEDMKAQAQTKRQDEYERGYNAAQAKAIFTQDSFIQQLKILRSMQTMLSTEHIDQLAISYRF